MPITTIKIHPAIGIARLGNSPTAFFIGPELPGDRTPPPGGYKDPQCRIKRQAARFRLFGYDETGALVKEITAADGAISWTAHLANGKAAWDRFHIREQASPGKRNAGVADRSTLVIDPGPRTINGPDQAAGFNTGHFKNVEVPLGEMRTDGDGRLLILGGSGSAGSPSNATLTYWAESDDWYDDVSDGPVTATVTLNGSALPITAAGAWVICAPPKFAPVIDNVVTLYDTLLQQAVDTLGFTPPAIPSFNRDIFPILERASNMKWVTQKAAFAHSSLAGAYPPAAAATRQAVTSRLRDPALGPHTLSPPGHGMPMVWSDVFDFAQGIGLALTKTQYKYMQQWAAGNFTDDWTGAPPLPGTAITPEGLDRSALENCVGGAFYPGIETSWMTRDVYTFTEPFRPDGSLLQAGDLTKQMAVPWHSDFYDCSDGDAPLSWWPAQRPVDVWPEDGSPQISWTRDLVTDFKSMVQNWFRLGIIVKKGSDLVETERHVVCKSLTVVTDRSSFGMDEVDGVLTGGAPAVFDSACYVIVEGFLPAELGISSNNPSPANLSSIAPAITLTRPDSSPVAGLSAHADRILFEDSSVPALLRQRFTFVYSMQFGNTDAFTGIESEKELITASSQGLQATGSLTLTHQPNPFMKDGPVSWLAVDTRVFKLSEGDSRFGLSMGNTSGDALSYISQLLGKLNKPGQGSNFDTISTDQQVSQLELARSAGGKRVFNFAIAKVRYYGKQLPATDVRVFFRLFTTAATGMEYNTGSTYRHFDDGVKVVPLLGFQGGEVVSIPCFAEVRIDPLTQSMNDQVDGNNIRTLQPGGATEVDAYFGCWLDINQTEKVLPVQPYSGDGQYAAGNLRSVQDTIRGLHQCLVTELFFPPDPILPGETPASSDNLCQRNLAIVESDNPGSPGSRTVAHTFELRPSFVKDLPVVEIEMPAAGVSVGVPVTGFRSTHFETGPVVKAPPLPPDELMLQWHNLPAEADITIYLPQATADQILETAGRIYETRRLEKVDAHTIRCQAGDITYMPIPALPGSNLAGLLTINLPEHIKYGQVFRVTAHQVSGAKRSRRIIGAFQVTIPVVKAASLLGQEMNRLAVLRSIARSILPGNRWTAVFERYLAIIAGRVSGFGGNPDLALPSPDGYYEKPGGAGHDKPEGHGHCHEHTPESCAAVGTPADLIGLGIPWAACEWEGELTVKIRFHRKK